MESSMVVQTGNIWKERGRELLLEPPTSVLAKTIKPPTFLYPIRQNECCAKCSMIPYTETVSRHELKHYNLVTLRVSASRGCPVCRFFYQEVATQPHLHILEQNQDARMKVVQRGPIIEVIDFSSKSKLYELYQQRDGPHQIIQATTLRDVQSHPLSAACWQIAENWIRTCSTAHENCERGSLWLRRNLPTRVIDISGDRPKLVDGIGITAKYTALSHCWGQGHHPLSRTTSKTIGDFRNGIDFFDMPRSFQDAIEVTRRSFINYIWIDSLCIIQDSIEDWQREAQKMGEYYQNCFLTISALDAPENNTGFLMSRQPSPTVQIEGNLFLRPARRSWRKVFQESPLSRRAWVLQERLVSSRVLHYGQDDMFWECLTCSTRESDLTEYRLKDQNIEWLDENFKRSLEFPLVNSLPFLQANTQDALGKWYRVVAQYSRLSMSHESDMLPAISAIADRIKVATGYTYLAGLWQEDLHTGLLWYADGPKLAPRIWRAPSWSWAQLTGPVLQIYGQRSTRNKSQYDLIIAKAELEWSDSLGKFRVIQDASLTVWGFTSPVWIKGSQGSPPYNNPGLKLVLDIFDQSGLPCGTGYLDTLIDDNPVRQCKALAISERFDPEVGMGESWLYFLLIEPVEDGSNIYKRVGIGQALDPYRLTVFDRNIFDQCSPEELILS